MKDDFVALAICGASTHGFWRWLSLHWILNGAQRPLLPFARLMQKSFASLDPRRTTRNFGENVKRGRFLFVRNSFRRIAGSFRHFLLGPRAMATIPWYAPGRLVASRQ